MLCWKGSPVPCMLSLFIFPSGSQQLLHTSLVVSLIHADLTLAGCSVTNHFYWRMGPSVARVD